MCWTVALHSYYGAPTARGVGKALVSARQTQYKRSMSRTFIEIALGSTAGLVAIRFALTAEWSVVGLCAMILVAIVAGRRDSLGGAVAEAAAAADQELTPGHVSVR